jgi:hypothetical protein
MAAPAPATVTVLAAFALLGGAANASSTSLRAARHEAGHDRGLRRHLGLSRDEFYSPTQRNLDGKEEDIPGEACFNQTLDHLTGKPGSWLQHYYFNEEYWDPEKGGPVFLMLGGEGPASPLWLSSSEPRTAMMVYAEEHGAAVYELEHRFYGKSQPFGDLSTQHMSGLLSSRQVRALATLEHLRRRRRLPCRRLLQWPMQRPNCPIAGPRRRRQVRRRLPGAEVGKKVLWACTPDTRALSSLSLCLSIYVSPHQYLQMNIVLWA